MGEVTDYPTFRLSREVQDLQQRVTELTGLVAGLMAVLVDRRKLKERDLLEVRFAGEHAAEQGPMLGQPYDEVPQSAAGYALDYWWRANGCLAPCEVVQAVVDGISPQNEDRAGVRDNRNG